MSQLQCHCTLRPLMKYWRTKIYKSNYVMDQKYVVGCDLLCSSKGLYMKVIPVTVFENRKRKQRDIF